MTQTSMKNLDWIQGSLWPSLMRMESPRVRHPTSYYEEDGVNAAETAKGFAEHLLAKSTNRWRKIKWSHQRDRDFHSLRPSEIEPRPPQPEIGEKGEDDDEERLQVRFVLDRILPPAVWVEEDVVLEQRALADRPLRMDAIETEQSFQKQMANRFAHASALEICDVRRDIHTELGREATRQLACVDVDWGLLLHQILLEEEELMHHLRNLFVTGVEFGLVKLTSTEHSVESLKDGREALEAEVAEKTMELRAMRLKIRDLQESVKSDWDVLTWNNKLEKEKLSERKTFLKDGIARAARLLRHSFLWDDYDSMPIEPDIKAMLLEEVRLEEERREREEFELGESVESAVAKELKPVAEKQFGYPNLLVDVDNRLFEHAKGKYVEDLAQCVAKAVEAPAPTEVS